MGVGTPIDILEAVHRGVDMFDCILPTALAQQGMAYASHGKIDLRRGVHRLAAQPLDAACDCDACGLYSRSCLHHLVKCREPLGWQLLSFHNLRFYLRLMEGIREHILAGNYASFHAARRQTLALADQDNPPGPRPRVKPSPPLAHGAFAVHDSGRGWSSIRHVASGEIMHSVVEPDVEAAQVYVAQSAFIAQALAGQRGRPLVVWDVGLGAGHNAMALLRAVADRRLSGTPDGVTLISFERDLDAFLLALSCSSASPCAAPRPRAAPAGPRPARGSRRPDLEPVRRRLPRHLRRRGAA